MNKLEEEFVNSLKALLIRYNVEIVNDSTADEINMYYFQNKDKSIKIYVGDIE